MTQTRESWGVGCMRAMLSTLVCMAVCSRVAVGQGPVTPTPTPTPTPLPCAGDCNQDGEVTIEELITMVNIALGNASVTECEAGDGDQDGGIDIAEIITAVNAALRGCSRTPTVTPSPTFTPPHCGDGHIAPPEQCDDGNTVNGDGCSNCQVDPQFMCFGEPSQCFIVNCIDPFPTCSGGPAALAPPATPPPP